MVNGPVSFSGLVSGLNTQSIINAEMAVYEQPLTSLQNEQSAINAKISAYQTINSQLLALQQASDALADPTSYEQAFSTSLFERVGGNGERHVGDPERDPHVRRRPTGHGVDPDLGRDRRLAQRRRGVGQPAHRLRRLRTRHRLLRCRLGPGVRCAHHHRDPVVVGRHAHGDIAAGVQRDHRRVERPALGRGRRRRRRPSPWLRAPTTPSSWPRR